MTLLRFISVIRYNEMSDTNTCSVYAFNNNLTGINDDAMTSYNLAIL